VGHASGQSRVLAICRCLGLAKCKELHGNQNETCVRCSAQDTPWLMRLTWRLVGRIGPLNLEEFVGIAKGAAKGRIPCSGQASRTVVPQSASRARFYRTADPRLASRGERELTCHRRLIARAATIARVPSDIRLWTIMSSLAQRVKGATSVGEKAVLVLNARKR
jgi:hypothetical protein